MGTIAQKLTYLEDTKTAIGNAIAAKGGSVTGKTFRQYATEISNLPSGGDNQGFIDLIEDEVTVFSPPSGTTKLCNFLFYDKGEKLTTVNLPNSVTSIGNYAFMDIQALTSITFGNGLTTIGHNAFDGCTGLTSVTIPNSVTSIGETAFGRCSNLQTVTLPTNANFTVIPKNLFQNCHNFSSFTIPSSVTTIGESAYFNTKITTANIPNNVTTLGKAVFYYCTSLTSVTLPTNPNFTYIPYGFVQNCSNLTSITIPSNVTEIGSSAFAASGLTSIIMPDTVTTFSDTKQGSSGGSFYFDNCTNLASVRLPSSITEIYWGMFNRCSSLTSITIPSTVTKISTYAFQNCSSLTSITIPSGVTNIGPYSFNDCSSLTYITIEATTPPTLSNSNAFSNTNNCPIYVPAESVDTYKAATNWISLASRIQAIPEE